TATYYDAWMPYPERIALEIILDAETETPANAHAINYMKAVSAGHDTVILRDQLTDTEYTIKPKIVINAAGPWIDFANEKLNRGSQFIGGTKGSHLIVDHPELHAATHGHEMFFENADGRICLFFPLEDRVLIGTTDIRIDNPDDAICTEQEVDYMLEMVKLVFPSIHVDRSHIVYRFSGVRPLPSSSASTTGQISRDHSINAIEAGARGAYPVLSLVGGKWTTFRAFSEKVTDDVLTRLGKSRNVSTLKLPIGGGKKFPKGNRQRWINDQTLKTGLPRQTVEMLLNRYGGRAEDIIAFCQAEADAPLECVPDYTHREIVFLAQNEKIAHLEDLLLRRSLLAMLGKIDGAGLAELAHILAGVLGWNTKRTRQEIEQARQLLISRHGVAEEKLRLPTQQEA
ncbi:MAG TPA: FAD-dependent oxidoreductase, partial [Aggregatilineales bacterium]|nr:FAD-dependent oxidoreductase [Aggregatilineales bacterium]